jgi:hypothetical protein
MIAGCWVLGGVFDRCNGRTPRDLVTVANTFGIDNIILECGWFNEYKPYLREFVTVMADNGISVELLLADYSWSLAPKHSEALSVMEDVIEFVNEINDGSVVLRENTSACVSISERRACEDSDDWRSRNDRDCSWVARKNTRNRCNVRGSILGEEDVVVRGYDGCPKTCGSRCPCKDSDDWRLVANNGKAKDCSWVAKSANKRCKQEGHMLGAEGTVIKGKDGYPKTCGRCHRNPKWWGTR